LYSRWSAAFAAEPEMPLEKWCALIEEWRKSLRSPAAFDYVEVDAGGVPAMWISPKEATQDRVIVAIHGGGFDVHAR
jgi:epsilon-lactone hydrolase